MYVVISNRRNVRDQRCDHGQSEGAAGIRLQDSLRVARYGLEWRLVVHENNICTRIYNVLKESEQGNNVHLVTRW